MKLHKKCYVTAVALATAFFLANAFVSCSNGNDSNPSPEEIISDEEEDTQQYDGEYGVGKIITINQERYYVVSNTIPATPVTSNLSVIAREADTNTSDDITELVKAESIKRAKKFTKDYFGNHILLLRIEGKVQVPYGKKDEYQEAYNAVTKDLADDIKNTNKIRDYFAEDQDPTKDVVSYSDNYWVLNGNEEKIGSCLIVWDEGTNTIFEGGKKLKELIKDFSPDIIRRSIPGQYKIKEQVTIKERVIIDGQVLINEQDDRGKTIEYEVVDNKIMDTSGSVRRLEPAKNSLYLYNNRITKSATLQIEWDNNNNWTRSYMDLCAVFDLSATNKGIQLQVKKTANGYRYEILGSTNSGTDRYRISKDFTFNGNTYQENNVTVTPDDGIISIYSTDANLTYDEQTLSVPISFVLNSDGEVSFGQAVLDWVEHWRDYIVETNPGTEKFPFED